VADDGVNPAIPAATVVLLRDGPEGIETLMLHRTSKVAFGGMWVFPGGKVDDGDRRDHDPDDPEAEAAARRAASRESVEECGLLVEPDELVPFAHWTPPAITPRRYATWFFLARAADGEIVVDGGEIHDHRWLAPSAVLASRDAGEVDLAPPTWVTLHDLSTHATVDAALAAAAAQPTLPHYVTHWHVLDEGGAVALWHGDAGYEAVDHELPGARHRLWMVDTGWRLERT